MQYIDVYNYLEKEFYKTLDEEDINEMKLFRTKWYEYKEKFDDFLKFKMYSALEKYYVDNNLSSEDKLQIFCWFSSPTFKRGLYCENKCFIPTDIKYSEEFIYKLINGPEYFALAYLIDNCNGFIDDLRDNLDYNVKTSRLSYGILHYYNNVNNIDNYNTIFDDLCMHDSWSYSLTDFLKEKCKFLNEKNIMSLAKNLYMYGIYGTVGFEEYNKKDKIVSIINDKNISFSSLETEKLFDKFKNIDDSKEGINNLIDIFSLDDKTDKEKIKAYKLTNY